MVFMIVRISACLVSNLNFNYICITLKTYVSKVQVYFGISKKSAMSPLHIFLFSKTTIDKEKVKKEKE
jgi:hypothetical protein